MQKYNNRVCNSMALWYHPLLTFIQKMSSNRRGKPMDSGLSKGERAKRIREAIIILLAVILIIFLTRAEISLTQISADGNLGSNIVIFAM